MPTPLPDAIISTEVFQDAVISTDAERSGEIPAFPFPRIATLLLRLSRLRFSFFPPELREEPASPPHSSKRHRAFVPPSNNPDLPNPDLWPNDPTPVEPLALRRAPLLFAALCFALGELLATLRPHPPALLLLAATLLLTLALIALRTQTSRIAILPVAALWLTAGTLAYHLRPAPDPQAALRPFADNLSRTVVGRVIRVHPLPPRPDSTATTDSEHTWQPTDPEESAPQAEQVDLQLSRIEFLTPDVSTLVPIAGGVRVTLLTTPAAPVLPDVRCGDRLQLPVRLRLPTRYRDPGAWQYADYLLAQGISAHGTARAEKVSLQAHEPATLPCRLLAAQAWASGRLTRFASSPANRRLPALLRLSPTDTGMLAAMLFGDRTALTHSLRLGFERTGSFHLFVVSGMHVGLVAGLLLWLFRRLRLSDVAATLLTLPLLTAFALLTGFGAPVQRALAMTTVFLLARLLSRSRSVLNALGAAALFTLLWTPHALFEASFQMTMLAIIAIAGIAIPLGERNLLAWFAATRNLNELRLDGTFPPPLAQLRISLRLWSEALTTLAGPLAARAFPATLRLAFAALELVLIGLVAELVMALPMAVYFHRATLFALPANMASIPLLGILMPAAILTFLAALVSPWIALLPASLTAALLHAITFAIGHISRVPLADARVPPPSAPVIAAAVLALAFCCWAARRSARWALAAALTLPLLTLAILWPEPVLRSPNTLELTALDIGQGDSLLLIGAEGRTMLIDAGGPTGSIAEAASATSFFDVGEEVVAPYLWSRRIRRLDTLVLTHAHSDHMGGMPAILQDLRPRELWLSTDAHAAPFTALVQQARTLGTVVRFLHAGQTLPWGDEQIHVLSPDPAYINLADPKNDDSLVLRIGFGQASILLTGDAEAPSERAMLAAGSLSPVTLLKVGHHGSLTSTTPDFLAALAPHSAVISTGLGNHFGHPRPEILSRLAAQHTLTYRTDEFGLTTFLLSPDGRIRAVAGASNEDGTP